MKSIEERENEFADMLLPYENQWIAYVERRGRRTIVGSGAKLKDAIEAAEKKGHPNAVLFKVPPFRGSLIL